MDDPDADDAEESWEFSLSDIDQREADAEAAAEAEQQRNEPVEAGSPSIENAAFVLLGVGLALFVISRLIVG